MARLWRGLPATSSHGWLNQARHEQQEVATVPSQHREEAGRVPSYPDHGGLSSGEGATARKRRQRPHLRSIDRVEMITSKRRSRRSFGEGVVRVFAVASARELDGALGGNGGAVVRCCCERLKAKKGKLGRRAGRAGAWVGSCSGRPRQGVRGAWQRAQATGDARRTRGRRILKRLITVAAFQ